jgi:acetyl esterase/lipase
VASLASRLIPLFPSVRNEKRRFRDPEAMRRAIAAEHLRPTRFAPPARLDGDVDVVIHWRGTWAIYEVSPRHVAPVGDALYLHGGAYIYEITSIHWNLVARLASATSTRFTVPVYPLAPRATASDVVPTATDIVADLINEVGTNGLALMGDSAGGGMALAVAMQLRDRGLPAPRHTVLISPWLDVSMSDPSIPALDRVDPILAPAGLKVAASMYRGTLDERDPLVSPIHGELRDLGPITMFSGTHDILNADARRLVHLAAETGLSLDYREAPGMIHAYPLLPMPEGERARKAIETVLRG